MKRHLLSFLLIISAVACTTEELFDDKNNSSTIPVDEAVSLLTAILPQTKSDSNLLIDEIITVPKSSVIDGASSEGLVYIVNFANDEGCAILAADRKLPDPIIAILDNGRMDQYFKLHTPQTKSGSSQDSSGLFVEQLLLGYLLTEGGGGDGNDGEGEDGGEGGGNGNIGGGSGGGSSSWINYLTINPMVPLLWEQGPPFNDLCPTNPSGQHKPAGCVPVAVAMLMTYRQTPTNLSINDHYLDWDEMWDVCNCSSYLGSDTGIYDVSLLIKTIGVFCETYYTTNWSFTFPQKACDFLSMFAGYSNVENNIGYDEQLVLSMLLNYKPVIICAISGVLDGHAWVVDGLIRQATNTDNRELLHCNWGWGGICNGYYVSGIFDTTQMDHNDPTYGDCTGSLEYDFSWWYRIITY